MLTFLIAFLIFTGVALALWIPLAVIGRRKGRHKTVTRYVYGAIGTGVVCALVASSSERLVDQCEVAGNPTCIDFGATGIQMLLLGGYGFAVLLNAFLVYRD